MSDHRDIPAVTLKWAQTLDGRVATTSGHSRWISGEESRRLAHELRARHDAVLVGIGTVLADNPQLNVRSVDGRNPAIVVVDSHGRTPPDARLFDRDTQVLIATAPNGLDPVWGRLVEERGARLIYSGSGAGNIDLANLLRLLPPLGIRSVLVEGGARVVTSFLQGRLAHEAVIFIAPKVLGTGLDAVGELGIVSLDQSIALRNPQAERLGGDLVVRGTLEWPT